MEFFNKTKSIRLRSNHGRYLVADDNQETVRQSRRGSSESGRWLIEPVEHNPESIRIKSCHGRYLTPSNSAFLLGVTGNKVILTAPENSRDLATEWQPIKDGLYLKLRAFGGTYLRANGGMPPWKNSVTHDSPYTESTRNWVLWAVEAADDAFSPGFMSTASSFSSVSDDYESEPGSPASAHNVGLSPRLSIKKTGMDLFHNAKAVRLRSHHGKYLHAEDDEESVKQNRNGSSKSTRWTIEVIHDRADNLPLLRLKSCYGKYLTASDHPFLLGMTGRKVLQTVPANSTLRDPAVEWEPIIEGGNQAKLRTRYGHYLRANGGVPPWRNSVTHDVPQSSSTQDWILWEVHVMEIIIRSPEELQKVQSITRSSSASPESSSPSVHSAKPTRFGKQEHHGETSNGDYNMKQTDQSATRSGSTASETGSTSFHSAKSSSSGRQESIGSTGSSTPKAGDGRVVYYSVADELGNVDKGGKERCLSYNGNSVDELTRRIEDETGLKDIIVCSRSPYNKKLYPIRLQLPPNNVTMHIVIVLSSSKVASDFEKAGLLP